MLIYASISSIANGSVVVAVTSVPVRNPAQIDKSENSHPSRLESVKFCGDGATGKIFRFKGPLRY